MYGDMELYTTAKEKGVKPILGCEFYVHDGDILERDKAHNPCYHLVLLAKDKEGYANLLKLVSVAWCKGRYVHPRINWELLKEHHKGLICLSACLGGEVLQNLLKNDKVKAREVAQQYKDLFGEDYYIELQDHGMEEQKRTNPELVQIAKELGIKMVITNDLMRICMTPFFACRQTAIRMILTVSISRITNFTLRLRNNYELSFNGWMRIRLTNVLKIQLILRRNVI